MKELVRGEVSLSKQNHAFPSSSEEYTCSDLLPAWKGSSNLGSLERDLWGKKHLYFLSSDSLSPENCKRLRFKASCQSWVLINNLKGYLYTFVWTTLPPIAQGGVRTSSCPFDLTTTLWDGRSWEVVAAQGKIYSYTSSPHYLGRGGESVIGPFTDSWKVKCVDLGQANPLNATGIELRWWIEGVQRHCMTTCGLCGTSECCLKQFKGNFHYL